MKLIACKCSNCGASMQVDESKDTVVCTFCGTSFLVEKKTNYEQLDAEAADRYWGMVFDFTIHDGVLHKYNGDAEKVVIPKGVTQIKDAFKDCTTMKSVVIPESVTNIGNAAFYGCTGLTQITIPDSVTNIGAYAFEGCTNLTEIKLPSRLPIIRLGTFINCSSLTNITIPDGVVRIGDEAFRGCTGLTTVTMPDSATEFGSSVFANCGSLKHFIASEEWKKAHMQLHACLKDQTEQKPPCELPSKNAGCYVATAVYGSYDCPQVWVLRRFRDERLAATWCGRAFICVYYALSPVAVRLFGHTTWFQSFWRGRLDKMVRRLKSEGVADTPYRDKSW